MTLSVLVALLPFLVLISSPAGAKLVPWISKEKPCKTRSFVQDPTPWTSNFPNSSVFSMFTSRPGCLSLLCLVKRSGRSQTFAEQKLAVNYQVKFSLYWYEPHQFSNALSEVYFISSIIAFLLLVSNRHWTHCAILHDVDSASLNCSRSTFCICFLTWFCFLYHGMKGSDESIDASHLNSGAAWKQKAKVCHCLSRDHHNLLAHHTHPAKIAKPHQKYGTPLDWLNSQLWRLRVEFNGNF